MTMTAAAKKITHAELLRIAVYDPATGVFRWKVSVSRKARAGKVIGTRVQAHAAYVEAKRRLHEGCTL